MAIKLKCIECGKSYSANEVRYRCNCGNLLDVVLDLGKLNGNKLKKIFEYRLKEKSLPYSSGVWRYKELVLPIADNKIVSKNEGNTNLYSSKKIAKYCGLSSIKLKHEGENPTGSFKDRGMTAGITQANMLGAKAVACASTGNTSASMASYAAIAGMKSLVFIPEGKIAYGKLSQALAYGAKTMQIKGNFDDAMQLVQEVCNKMNIYLLNSLNPFRIEGQKAIIFEILQQLNWKVPDWIIVPGGNLGNNSAIAKGLMELYELGIIRKKPRIAVIQAHGANPLYRMWIKKSKFKAVENPETIATAIKIGNPVSWKKSLRAIKWSKGLVEEVTEQEIIDAKAIVDGSGIGAEPASCASVAGCRKLRNKGTIKKDDNVICILTGNLLKDPDIVVNYHSGKLKGLKAKYANKPIKINANINEIGKILK